MSTTPGIKIICTHEGCTERSIARRLCRAHYQAAWKAGKLGAHEKLPPRVKDPKVCPPDHKHAGSLVCYNLHQCRCTPCSKHRMATEERRRKDKAYGRYDTGLVDAEPVREHVLKLGEFGIGYKRVAELAGFKSPTPVRTIIWGRQDPGPRYGEMQKRIKRETAEKILAIEPKIENLGARQPVPALGAHRRVQALAARGWSLSKIGTRLGMEPSNFCSLMKREQIGAASWLAIAALYDELWDQEPPHTDWHDAGAYTRALNLAKRRGWLPPLAWDDIDTDPEPEIDVVSQARASGDEVLDEVDFLLEAGESPVQVAAILGKKLGAIAKLAERLGRRDIANVFGSLAGRVAA